MEQRAAFLRVMLPPTISTDSGLQPTSQGVDGAADASGAVDLASHLGSRSAGYTIGDLVQLIRLARALASAAGEATLGARHANRALKLVSLESPLQPDPLQDACSDRHSIARCVGLCAGCAIGTTAERDAAIPAGDARSGRLRGLAEASGEAHPLAKRCRQPARSSTLRPP